MKQRTNKKDFIIPPGCIIFKEKIVVDLDNIYKIEYNKKERLSMIFSYVDGNKETIYFDQLLTEPDKEVCDKIAYNVLSAKVYRKRWIDDHKMLREKEEFDNAEINGVLTWG